MNDYTLNIQFFIGMNYFFQKELGNLDFFSFFFQKTIFWKFRKSFLVSSTQNFSENSVNFETIPSSFGTALWKIFTPGYQTFDIQDCQTVFFLKPKNNLLFQNMRF